MVDVLTPKQRAFCMSRIRSSNTSPEMMLRKCIFRAGLRYRVKSKLIGKPDIVFPKEKVVVFIDGCFWHGCTLHSKPPSTNQDYWRNKIAMNITRDSKITKELEATGWAVIRLWEHDVKADVDKCKQNVINVFLKRKKWLANEKQ